MADDAMVAPPRQSFFHPIDSADAETNDLTLDSGDDAVSFNGNIGVDASTLFL